MMGDEKSKDGYPTPTTHYPNMSESLVVIRTFGNLLQADEAQIELLNAGIYSLLLSNDTVELNPDTPGVEGIALAVHRRDAEVASTVLSPLADPNLDSLPDA